MKPKPFSVMRLIVPFIVAIVDSFLEDASHRGTVYRCSSVARITSATVSDGSFHRANMTIGGSKPITVSNTTLPLDQLPATINTSRASEIQDAATYQRVRCEDMQAQPFKGFDEG